jgi:hypothetical protein
VRGLNINNVTSTFVGAVIQLLGKGFRSWGGGIIHLRLIET